MSEVTKDDINRLYDKLEPIGADVIIIKTKLTDHLKAHERWGKPMIRFVLDFVKMGVVCAVTWMFARR